MLVISHQDPRFFKRQNGCIRLIDLGAMTKAQEKACVVSDLSSAPELISGQALPSAASEAYSFGAFLFALFNEGNVPRNDKDAARFSFPPSLRALRFAAESAMGLDPPSRPSLMVMQVLLLAIIDVAVEARGLNKLN